MSANPHSHSTPWLTTRRRTCPICKGDVVRSMASASSSSSSTDLSSMRNSHTLSQSNSQSLSHSHEIADSDAIQAAVAHARNESPSAAIPIPHGHDSSDLERGDDLAATLVNDENEAGVLSSTWNWRELASRSFSAVRGDVTRTAPTQEDRSR